MRRKATEGYEDWKDIKPFFGRVEKKRERSQHRRELFNQLKDADYGQ